MAPSLAIIGGGYAGLTAAVSLTKYVVGQKVPITLFEQSHDLGGRARVMARRDPPLDQGQHILLGAYTNLLALMAQMGVKEEEVLLRIPLTLHVPNLLHLRARRLPAPAHLLAALLSSRGLDFSSKLSLIKAMKQVRQNAKTSGTFSQWLSTHQQNNFLQQNLWGPLCVSALNTHAEEASAQVMLQVLHDSLGAPAASSNLLLPRVGLNELFPEPAHRALKQAKVEVCLGTRVLSVKENKEGGFELAGADWQRNFSHLIVAVAPWTLVDLAATSSVMALHAPAQMCKDLSFRSIATAYFNFSDKVSFPCPMLGLAHPHAHWAFDLATLRGWQGWVAVVCSAAAIEANTEMMLGALRTRLGTLSALKETVFHHSKRATFASLPNLPRPKNETQHPHLFLCGDYTVENYPATLESAVRSGQKCAQLVAGQMNLPTQPDGLLPS